MHFRIEKQPYHHQIHGHSPIISKALHIQLPLLQGGVDRCYEEYYALQFVGKDYSCSQYKSSYYFVILISEISIFQFFLILPLNIEHILLLRFQEINDP